MSVYKIPTMDGAAWLDDIARRVLERTSDVEISRPDAETLGLSLGLRTVVVHASGDTAFLAPAFTVGGTLGSRLQDRVQHLEIAQYSISEDTIDVATEIIVSHLK